MEDGVNEEWQKPPLDQRTSWHINCCWIKDEELLLKAQWGPLDLHKYVFLHS